MLTIPLAFVALLVRLTSKGPVFFQQERMGLDGKSFTIVKFRPCSTTPSGIPDRCGRLPKIHA